MFRFAIFLISLLLLLPDLVAAQATNQKGEEQKPKLEPIIRLGRIEDKKINESSGLAFCSSRSAIWTHNDSGNANELYLLSLKGKQQATVKLKGTGNRDWESMCHAHDNDKNYLVVGDVGDNRNRRTDCCLYVIAEPDFKHGPKDVSVTAKKIEFTYPGGPRNCEAISYEATKKEIWLIEKRYVDDKRPGQPGIYAIPFAITNSPKGKPLQAKRIGNFPVRNVTGMAFSPDGKYLAIRNYLNAHLFIKPENKTWREVIAYQRPKSIVMPVQQQGEAICFTPDSKSLIVSSEGNKPAIWQVNFETQLN